MFKNVRGQNHCAYSVLGILLLSVLMSSNMSFAYDPTERKEVVSTEVPAEIQDVGVTEHLGEQLDLGLEFTNENGQPVQLRELFHKDRPVIMAMVYYSCPNLCNFQLNGLVDALKKTKGTPGKDYDVVAISMDHKETPDLAAKKKANYLKELAMPGSDWAWHFLVGSEKNVKAIAEQFGFKFKWSEAQKQYAHAAATYIVTPSGVLSRYFYGIDFKPETLRLSLVEASGGKIGNVIEQIVLYCFQFDATKNKYTIYAWRVMQAGAFFTVLLIGAFLAPSWWRERKRLKRQATRV